MNNEKLKCCPVCDGDLIEETRTISTNYKNISFEFSQPGRWCSECGEGFLTPKDLDSSKRDIADNKRIIEHRLKSDEIKKFRKKEKLTQKQAGEIFGGGANAFSKYERGEIIQSKSTDVLMRLVKSKKITIEDIKKIEEKAKNETDIVYG